MANRYRLRKNEELTGEKILEFIRDYEMTEIPKMNRRHAYFTGDTDIKKRTQLNSKKPNNKKVFGLGKTIVNSTTNYFIGNGVKYESNELDLMEKVFELMKKNKDSSIVKRTAIDVSVFGKAYNIHYINEETGEFEYDIIDPRTAFLVYSDKNPKRAKYGIRFYYDLKTLMVDVYSNEYITSYQQTDKGLFEVESEFNMFGIIPLVEFADNNEFDGDLYDEAIDLINAYEEVRNGELNERQSFELSYMIMSGMADVADEDVQRMKDERNNILMTPEGGHVAFLQKDINFEYIKDLRESIMEDIFRITCLPDKKNRVFSANASGETMKIIYHDLENKIKSREESFESGIKQRINIISSYLNLMSVDDAYYMDFMEVTIKRNVVASTKDQIEVAKSLIGFTSKQTALGALPSEFVEDVAQEMERLEEEQAQSMYGSLDENAM